MVFHYLLCINLNMKDQFRFLAHSGSIAETTAIHIKILKVTAQCILKHNVVQYGCVFKYKYTSASAAVFLSDI